MLSQQVTANRGNAVIRLDVETLHLFGFPFIQHGAWSDMDWQVDGKKVTGTVKRKDGRVEGTFDGTVTATGVSGKFTHRDGRVGLWSWDGPPPQAAMSGE